MRLLMIAPMLLLAAPANGGWAAVDASDVAPAAATVHSLCGDDTIAPSTAHILPGFGAGGMPIAAKPQAQAFFDSGMQLAHAFAHQAATGAFKEAARLDPLCDMCLWGEAWSEGPTINFTIDAATQVKAGKLVDTAERLAATGSALEQQMIAALKLRYRHGGGKGSGDLAFARAMDAIARAHPDSDELMTIAADAWMIPAALRDSKDNVPRAVELLETVLKRNPDYTPAIHFYIHATEMMGYPAKAEPYANRLPALAPGASHLIHMPSHTYYWVGRYQDAATANVRAAALADADVKAAKLTGADSIWRLDYHAHNVQFGIGGALISGDAEDALSLARPMLDNMRRHAPETAYGKMAAGTAYAAEGRFADPAAVMALADPGPAMPLVRAYWHYARGEALARQGNAADVQAEAAAITIPALPDNADKAAKAARDMARIARLVLVGRAAMLAHHPDQAIKPFMQATAIEESKVVTYFADPPAWWYPVRRSVAAALLAAGRPADALAQADAALKRRPLDPVTTALRADIQAAIGKPDAARADRVLAGRYWHGNRQGLERRLI